MRLNFSGVGEDDLREGVARIGQVVSEQVRLYSTLTGMEPAAPRAAAADEPASSTTPHDTARRASEGGRIVPLRRRAG
jgi:2-aminoadipate transaminase